MTTIELLNDVKQQIRELKEYEQELIKELKANCKHEDTRVREIYYSGTYYDTAYTEFTEFCNTCGKQVNQWERRTSYYG